MKRAAWICLLAIFLPACVLGVLAWITAREQRLFLERQETLLRQQQADAAASRIRLRISAEYERFAAAVDALHAGQGLAAAIPAFPAWLPKNWRPEAVGFVTTRDGQLLAPSDSPRTSPVSQNIVFFGGQTPAAVYQTLPGADSELYQLERDKSSVVLRHRIISPPSPQEPSTANESTAPPTEETPAGLRRSVTPQQLNPVLHPAEPTAATVRPEWTNFGAIVSEKTRGILARFAGERLLLCFWIRPDWAPDRVFGAQIDPADWTGLFEPLLLEDSPALAAPALVALLNDRARPVARSFPSNPPPEWKRPFVATEIGEVLPHWEVAIYHTDPAALGRSARGISLLLMATVALAVGAIVLGGLFLAWDAQRQFHLARQKTDFVSNVSHELKTPLTSIRMFAELLQHPGPRPAEKTGEYLRIIRLEADRLTRLINNVLDFARLEHHHQRYDKRPLDLQDIVQHVLDLQQPHLQQAGFTVQWRESDSPCPVLADEDALSQILLNLLSNAEKYSGNSRTIEVECAATNGSARVSILDRGPGVPAGHEEKIFNQFHRAHDSLASGIPGAGLGLTLARRLARDLGGDLTHAPRPAGGTIFTLQLPLHTPVLKPET